MTDKNQLKDRARDELFSHINRCGVLQAADDHQEHWLDETIEYLGERYPDLGEADLRELRTLGLRFCRPAISNSGHGGDTGDAPDAGEAGEPDEGSEPVTAVAEEGSTG